MNPVVGAQLREFSKANNLNSERQDVQFEIYSIFCILTGLLGEGIDSYDVHLKGNEFGLDGIAIIVQGELVKNRVEAVDRLSSINNPSVEFVFFQSKTSTSYEYGDISKFFDSILGFFNGDLKGESCEIDELIDAMNAIYEQGVGKRNPKISCYYIATGNYEEPARIEKLRTNFKTQLRDTNIFDRDHISVDFVGAADLQQYYRAATTSVEVEIDFTRNVVLPSNSHVEEAYIGYIDATNLLKLFTLRDQAGEVIGVNRSVFFDNIRDYDPRSKINIAVKENVRSHGGQDFVFRNNGITLVSKNIDRTGDRFRLEDFQIVNGCQTSNIIYDLVFGEDDSAPRPDLAGQLQVPLRLIGSKDDDFVSSIIIGTNRQNPVRDDQFWALRPFMKSFEEYCRNLDAEEVIYFERRDNQYRKSDIERTRVMQPSVVMKSVAACLLAQPHRAARDYRGIIAEYESSLFLDDHDVRIYHAVSYLYYRLEFLWRNQKISNDHKTFRYYILAGVALSESGGLDVFSLKKSRVAAIAQGIIKVAKDEERLKHLVEKAVSVVEERLRENGIVTQEKIRDAIRSDTFANEFKVNFLKIFSK